MPEGSVKLEKVYTSGQDGILSIGASPSDLNPFPIIASDETILFQGLVIGILSREFDA
jgi:hypothetical protein